MLPKNRLLQKLLAATVLGATFAAALGGCTNSTSTNTAKKSKASSTNTAATDSTITYTITNVTIAAGTSATQLATLFFSAADQSKFISNSCSSGASSSKPCVCQFEWQEINVTGNVQIPIPRFVTSDLISIQPNVVTCNAPTVYATEIVDNTQIKISVIPSNGNGNSFTMTPYNYLKAAGAATGSFQDVEGKAFDNILRYSCYETTTRGTTILSKKFPVTNSADGTVKQLLMASDFCVSKRTGGTATEGCAGLPGPQATAQAYYYNLYIRNTDRGNINVENTRYRCPLVKETLNSINTTGSQTDYWPLDTSFALALSRSNDYNVGVEAFSKLGIGSGDPGSQISSCAAGAAGASGGSVDGTLIRSCLGFAAKPSAEGTCPMITLPSGQKKNTFRLRRFIALYPPLYDADGKMIPESQGTDTLYVADRPVTYASAPIDKPYTMRGPKPCPFAYFDGKAVTDTSNDVDYLPGGRPAYVATTNPLWNGTNVDGTQFPNIDIAGNSCSTAFAVTNSTRTGLSLGTLHSSNPTLKKMYVRPVQSWAPHYEEDADFLACAPQSAPFIKDPPLHFSKDVVTGNVSWCAEAYPTQNPKIGTLDRRLGGSGNYPGKVMNYTSHVVKNSVSPVCTGTVTDDPILSSTTTPTYPAAIAGACTPAGSTIVAQARHPASVLVDSGLVPVVAGTCGSSGTNTAGTCYWCTDQTCDRTVVNNNATLPFPLIARAPQVEAAIAADSTYSCMVTYDAGGSKTGQKTPTQGCCGNSVKVWTGNGATSDNIYNKAAHLEPNEDPMIGTLCAQPAY